MTMVEIAKRNNVSERTIYRYKTIFSWQEQRPQGSEKPRRKACSPDQQKRAGRGFWGSQRAYLNAPQKTVFTSVL